MAQSAEMAVLRRHLETTKARTERRRAHRHQRRAWMVSECLRVARDTIAADRRSGVQLWQFLLIMPNADPALAITDDPEGYAQKIGYAMEAILDEEGLVYPEDLLPPTALFLPFIVDPKAPEAAALWALPHETLFTDAELRARGIVMTQLPAATWSRLRQKLQMW